jgi:acyl-CoA reductase-like NAD-dependent aldehyde dehydrogenase
MAAWKLAPALAAGCTVVLKPAEETPLSALVLARILESLELPPGVVNVITGDGPGAGAALVEDPRVDKIAFTGGGEAGRIIIKTAADTIKRMSIELGGKNPNVVFADADFDQAVDGALFGAFANQGEVCSAGSRLLVERGIYDRMLAALADKVGRVRLGDPLARETKMGPLVTAAHMDKVLAYVEIGKTEGRLLAGGGRARGPGLDRGNFVEPTIFADVEEGMTIAQEEIFGPVLAVMRAKNFDDAMRIANNIPFGLSSSIQTTNLSRAFDYVYRMEAGLLTVNLPSAGVEYQLPFGGTKDSSFGPKEQGPAALEFYSDYKTVYLKY